MADRSGDARLAALGEIAAEIAHELRNSLQLIGAAAFVARRSPESVDEQLAKIERHARRAHNVVDDLLALARGDATTGEAVSLADVLLSARAEIEPSLVRWDDDVPTSLEVAGHAGLLARALHALYENAVQASAGRVPTITTAVERLGGAVLIEVADDGPGVPEEIAQSVFEPLVSRRAGGSGLGLALARRIVEAHEGTIELVPSTGGAVFRIVLSLARR